MRRRLPFPGCGNNKALIFILSALAFGAVGGLKAVVQKSDPIVDSSRYLAMRDGVRIAVDLYLPRNQPASSSSMFTPRIQSVNPWR